MIQRIGFHREIDDASRLINAFRRRRFRTHGQFAEDEIILPNGPFVNQRFRLSTQPFARLLYDEIDSGRYSEIIVTGPSQTGKTLIAWVIPLLHMLFEKCETCIAAVPDYDMVMDKWEQDIEPVLRLTRYWRYMPAMGRGSKGGRTAKITFKHGPELRWMTAGGGDKARAAYTARSVFMTETDGFDTQATTSTETSKIGQIEARQRAWKRHQRFTIKEGTLTTKNAHTWSRYCSGTCSVLQLPCPHCGEFGPLNRKDLHGWQSATTDAEAEEKSLFHCPACGESWTETERADANQRALLVHKGQSVVKGKIVGPRPNTRTLGFRWSAANNLLVSAGDIGSDEFEAARAVDEDEAQRKLCQFVWAVPYEPIESDGEDEIDAKQLCQRMGEYVRGDFPPGAVLSLGIDVNKPVLHWTVTALQRNEPSYIVDYGKQGLRTKDIGFAAALTEGLMKLRSRIDEQYPQVARAGVDSRWRPNDVAAAIKELKDKRFRAFIGMGKGQFNVPDYSHPVNVAGDVVSIGNNWFEKVVRSRSQIVVCADANFWKSNLKARLVLTDVNNEAKKIDRPILLYRSVDDTEHFQFCRHITAEEQTIEFDAKRMKDVVAFKQLRKANHWLDSTYISLVVGDKQLAKLYRNLLISGESNGNQ